jgi:hypothetical protein
MASSTTKPSQRERQQAHVVERESEHGHAGKGADDRQRQGQGRNESGAPGAQERQDHQDHQDRREHQRDLHIVHGGADRLRPVAKDGEIYRGGQEALELGEHGPDIVDHRYGVGIGLPLHVDDDRALAIELGARLDVLDRVLDSGDILQAHRRAVAPCHDQRLEVRGCRLGALHLENVDFLPRADGSYGRDAGLPRHRLADLLGRNAAARKRVEIILDPNCALLQPVDADLGHARDRRQPRAHHSFRELVYFRRRRGIGGQRQEDDGCIGGIDPAVGRRHRQVVRQPPARHRDRRLDIQSGGVDVAIEVELQRDPGAAGGVGRRDRVDAGDGGELPLEGRRHGDGHGVRARARIAHRDADRRHVDARDGGDGQLAVAEEAGQQERRHQQRRHHRAVDADLWKTHFSDPLPGPRRAALASPRQVADAEIADCRSGAAASRVRLLSNSIVIFVLPSVVEDVIDVTPAMVENCRSSVAATELAIVSALAPG